jgi:hypothetical protein
MFGGFILAMPATGWLDVVAAALMIGGFIAQGIFLHLNSRDVPRDQQGPFWWSGWNKR